MEIDLTNFFTWNYLSGVLVVFTAVEMFFGMYLDRLEEELGSVDALLAEGRISEITKWLNEKIHQYGSTRSPKEVIRYVCGKEVSAEPLIRYFKEKYTKVYNLG
jgi:carboxypeptidase Taq